MNFTTHYWQKIVYKHTSVNTKTQPIDGRPTPKQTSPDIVQYSVLKKINPIFIISTAYKCNNSDRTPYLALVL